MGVGECFGERFAAFDWGVVMSGPLHTDDVGREGNLSAAEYAAQHRERAERLGDDGLHIVPADVLAAAYERLGHTPS